MSGEVLKRISDRTISEEELKSELRKLGDLSEPPSFWLDIADDPAYPALHRAVAVCQFFKRHLKEPIRLVDLPRRFKNPDWIDPGAVTAVTHLKGEVPVEWNRGERVLAIRLFPGRLKHPPVLYLRLSQPLTLDAALRTLKGRPEDPTAAGTWVLEAACE